MKYTTTKLRIIQTFSLSLLLLLPICVIIAVDDRRRGFGLLLNRSNKKDTNTATAIINVGDTGTINTELQQNLATTTATATAGGSNSKSKLVLSTHNSVHDIIKKVTHRGGDNALAIIGTFSSITKKCSTLNWSIIKSAVWKAIDISDLFVLITIGYFTEPITKYFYNRRLDSDKKKKVQQDKSNESTIAASGTTKTTTLITITDYIDSYWYKTANVIQELGRLGCFMYGIDLLSIIIRQSGFSISNEINNRIGQTSIVIWSASRIRKLKQIWMYKIMKQHPEGRAAVLSKVLDGSLLLIVYMFLSDIFQVTIGKGLQSIAAVGGLSTILFGLAAKDFAQMLIAGIAIYNSDKFYEGEIIKLGDGTIGKIHHQGYFELHISGPDGIVTRIPNGQIINQRVQNLSRTTTSTIKQVLWFKYDDINKLPIVLQSIVDEITISCTKNLIKDDSKTVQAIWTNYKHDHLEVEVEASFTISPTSEEYDSTKQSMLLAIARAVENNHIQFAIPTSLCLSKEIRS